MEQADLFFRTQHRIKGFHVDRDRKATIPALIRIIHDTAMQHVMKAGMSALELGQYDLTWVIHREHIELFRRPVLGETISVLTYASGLDRLFTYRDFKWHDAEGHLIGQAASTWFLMNTKSRKVGQYPDDIKRFIELSNENEHLPRPLSIPPKNKEPDWQHNQEVRFHDLDFNGHLSNYYFAKWMLDNMPIDWFDTREIATFSLNFREECKLGDQVFSNACQESNDKVWHQLKRGDKEVARGFSQWKNK